MDILARNIWERKYLDLWTLVHFLTGTCFGFSIFFYHSPFLESLVLFIVLIILWEVFEYYNQAKEPLANQVTDIVAGILGFLITVELIPVLASNFSEQMVYFTFVYILAWTGAYYGFQSFALHFDREMSKYKRSFSAATLLYVVIVVTLVFFR